MRVFERQMTFSREVRPASLHVATVIIALQWNSRLRHIAAALIRPLREIKSKTRFFDWKWETMGTELISDDNPRYPRVDVANKNPSAFSAGMPVLHLWMSIFQEKKNDKKSNILILECYVCY